MGPHPEPLYQDEDAGDDRKAAQRAARSLAAKVAKLHGELPMPIATQQLLAATASNDYRVPEVVRIIGSDPMLAARIMRQVQGALLGRTPCASIAQAVTLIGIRTIRTIALAATVFELASDDEGPVVAEAVKHAQRTAQMARRLAPLVGLAPDVAYTCALLHDIGRMLLLRGDDLDYGDLLRNTTGPDCLHVLERARYGYDHALLGGHVLHAWKLPQPIPRVVSWHHQPRRAFVAAGQVPQLVASVRLADHLAYLDVVETSAVYHTLSGLTDELRVLGLALDDFDALVKQIRDACTGSDQAPPTRPSAAPEDQAFGLRTNRTLDGGRVSAGGPRPPPAHDGPPGRPSHEGPPPLPLHDGPPPLPAHDGPPPLPAHDGPPPVRTSQFEDPRSRVESFVDPPSLPPTPVAAPAVVALPPPTSPTITPPSLPPTISVPLAVPTAPARAASPPAPSRQGSERPPIAPSRPSWARAGAEAALFGGLVTTGSVFGYLVGNGQHVDNVAWLAIPTTLAVLVRLAVHARAASADFRTSGSAPAKATTAPANKAAPASARASGSST